MSDYGKLEQVLQFELRVKIICQCNSRIALSQSNCDIKTAKFLQSVESQVNCMKRHRPWQIFLQHIVILIESFIRIFSQYSLFIRTKPLNS